MSTPTPGGFNAPRVQNVRRRLEHNETVESLLEDAPQIARPFLMSSISSSDWRSVEFGNRLLMSWNGVIIDTGGDRENSHNWVFTEPYRRLDGSIVYGDGWERHNDGCFRAPSGLMIREDLCLVHRNGHHVFQDGITIAPSGARFPALENSVGIIYRPGTSSVQGVQHYTQPEPELDLAVRDSVTPSDYTGQAIPQSAVQPWEDVARIRANGNGYPYGQQERWPNGGPAPTPSPGLDPGPPTTNGVYVPPHLRQVNGTGRVASRSPSVSRRRQRRMQLTREELHDALPDDLKQLVDDCDMDGCGQDVFGIPLCVPITERHRLVPIALEALRRTNEGGS